MKGRLRTLAEKRTSSRIPVFARGPRAGAVRVNFYKEPTLSPVSRTPATSPAPESKTGPSLLSRILTSLDDDKAEDIVTIDLAGRSALCDALVIATGRSQRHVASTAEHLARRLKEAGYGASRVEGLPQGDWVLVDAGDVIVHLFRPEVRAFYDLEGMWSVDEPRRQRKAVS